MREMEDILFCRCGIETNDGLCLNILLYEVWSLLLAQRANISGSVSGTGAMLETWGRLQTLLRGVLGYKSLTCLEIYLKHIFSKTILNMKLNLWRSFQNKTSQWAKNGSSDFSSPKLSHIVMSSLSFPLTGNDFQSSKSIWLIGWLKKGEQNLII